VRYALIIGIIFGTGIAPMRAAAAQAAVSRPVAISGVVQAGSKILFNAANVSGKDIRAVVFACRFGAANGQPGHGAMYHTEIAGLTPEPEVTSFQAGTAEREQLRGLPRARSGQATAYALSLDYVLFTDGTGWGPDTRKESLLIRGFINGLDQEVMALQFQLKNGATDSVLQYIRDFRPVR
jgi:hypothetical protein